jgi:tetratricopeptide (TPR) repeat protein
MSATRKDSSSIARKAKPFAIVLIPLLGALAALFWLLTAYHSPFNPRILALVASRQSQATPALAWRCRRAGWAGHPGRLRISGLHLLSSCSDELSFDEINVRLHPRSFFRRILSIRDVRAQGVRFLLRIDPHVPFLLPPLPDSFDADHMPEVLLQDLEGLVVNQSPSHENVAAIHFSSGIVQACSSPLRTQGPAFGFHIHADAAIDNHPPAPLRAQGFANPRNLDPQHLDLDFDLTLEHLPITALATDRSRKIPFIAQSGALAIHLNLCARDGRLSGLFSLRIRDLVLRENPLAPHAKFLTLSLKAWQSLARQSNGNIDADADIKGTVLAPVVPIGLVLQDQVQRIGGNVVVHLASQLPGDGAKQWAKQLENQRSSNQRHDDIQKIMRLPEHERHFERGRHFDRIVKNHLQASQEYLKQVELFPSHDHLAVQALFAASTNHFQLEDPRQAMSLLRRILNEYPSHPDADNALFNKIEMARKIRDFPKADSLCREFLERFPRSDLAERVKHIRKEIASFVW